jgi:predicted nucleic acid-binding protein
VKIFLDANVLVTVLNKEYPLFPQAARLLSLTDSKKHTVWTSPICLAIAFYFAEKKSGSALAKRKIALLTEKLNVSDVGATEVRETSSNQKIYDFEDGLEYYSAKNSGCSVIVTEDDSDFYFSDIEVIGIDDFLRKYIL